MSNSRCELNANITKAVPANILTLVYSLKEEIENCNSENIIAALTALGDMPHNQT